MERDAIPASAGGVEAGRRAELEQEHYLAAKVFRDTERTLRYVCEAPVKLEARLGDYARSLAALLPDE